MQRDDDDEKDSRRLHVRSIKDRVTAIVSVTFFGAHI